MGEQRLNRIFLGPEPRLDGTNPHWLRPNLVATALVPLVRTETGQLVEAAVSGSSVAALLNQLSPPHSGRYVRRLQHV